MILVVAVGLVAVSVLATGGSLAGLAGLKVRAWWALGLALALQVLIISVIPKQVVGTPGQALQLVSYLLAGVFLLANLRVPWLWLVGLGGISNLAAIAANGGVMPASPVALRAAGRAQRHGQFLNSTAVPHAHLAFLGDNFSIPRGWPFANIFSVGDVVLVAGALLLLHTVGESWPARVCGRCPRPFAGRRRVPAHSARSLRGRPVLSPPSLDLGSGAGSATLFAAVAPAAREAFK